MANVEVSKRWVPTEEDRRDLERLAGLLTLPQLAAFFKTSVTTLKRRMDEEPDLMDSYQKGRAAVIGRVAQSLVQNALDGNVTAAIFYLKTQGGWKEKKEEDRIGDLSPQEFATHAMNAARAMFATMGQPPAEEPGEE